MTKSFKAMPPSRTRAVHTTARTIFLEVPFFTRLRKSTSLADSSDSGPVRAAMASFWAVQAEQVSKCRSTASFASSPRRFST